MNVTARMLAAVVLVLLQAAPAAAHRSSPAGPTTGLSLPSVTHGQMIVLAAHLPAIRALADAQYSTDPPMRRLQAYINLQHFYCAWGLVPGSLSDEESPFNECTHATLAGVRALLLHLRDMPGGREAKLALARTIDVEMLEHDASMVLCRFSDEPFNTADVIIPHLGAVLTNPTCLAVLLAIGLVALLCGAAASMAEQAIRRRERGARDWASLPS